MGPIIESMGVWGQRSARGDVAARHMDAGLLMWDIHRSVATEKLPGHRVVVQFHLRGSTDTKSRFWLVLDRGTADVCLSNPGYEGDLHVATHVRTMIDYWMGRLEFADAVRDGDLGLEGPANLKRAFRTWLARSLFASVGLP